MPNKTETQILKSISTQLGIPLKELRKVVYSYFDSILLEAHKLPFDNRNKIYKKDLFEKYSFAYNIPHIGRIGPVYSRYLKWRGNELEGIEQEHRSRVPPTYDETEIEVTAAKILRGEVTSIKPKKKLRNVERVWVVDSNGKKLARQIIKK